MKKAQTHSAGQIDSEGVNQGKMGERNDMQDDLADIFRKEIKIGFGKPFVITHGKFSFFFGEKMVNITEQKRKGKAGDELVEKNALIMKRIEI